MANISGNVLFNVTNSAPTTGNAISSVPVVLRNTSSGVGLSVLTNASGSFTFTSVPNGTYTLVEAWGTTIPSVATPGDFTTATTIPAPTPRDPPIGSVPSPPPQANAVESLSPNTLNLTVSGATLTNQNFIDGPVNNVSSPTADIVPFGPNLITVANNGNWGTLPAGTPVNSSPATEPYPGVVPGYTYTSRITADGQYSVSNINTLNQFGGAWFNFADHTSRDETGRFQIVGGFNPGSLVFTQNITVIPNSYLLLDLWVMNILTNSSLAPPRLGVLLKTTTGTTIVNYSFSNLSFSPIPTWTEQATPLFVGNNTALIFQVVSNGSAAAGNDYAIDDISVRSAIVSTIVNTSKTVNKTISTIGDNLIYTTVITNTGQSTAVNIRFLDSIPNGTAFVPGSVIVNNVSFPSLNPTPPGFTITLPSSLASGSSITISFNVNVNTVPSPNPINNSSQTTYDFVPIPGGSTVTQTVLSNTVSTQINVATISRASKSVDKAFANVGDILTYTIGLTNSGSVTANNVILIDTIPNNTTFVNNSVVLNGLSQPGATVAPPTGFNVGSINPNGISTVSFNVVINTIPNPNPIPNSAFISYSFTISAASLTTGNGSSNSNIVNTQVNYANLGISSKSADRSFADIGDNITYTVLFQNTGNVTADNVIIRDTIPNGTSFVPGSAVVNNVPSSTVPVGNVLIVNSGNVPANGFATLTFKVTVNTIPSPNPIPNSANASFNYTVNPSSPDGQSGSSNTNTVNTQVNNANLRSITKSTNNPYVNCGDIITYTISIPNNGNTTALNVILSDTVPNNTTFVPGSILVNGSPVGGNPSSISIGNISPGATATTSFKVQVQC